MVKKEKVCTVTVADDCTALTFDFPTLGKRHVVTVAALDRAIIARATVHGLEQKLRDAMALGVETVNGRVIRPTAEAKYAEFRDVLDRLTVAGEWNAAREGGGFGGLLFAALQRYMPAKTADEIRDWLDGKDAKQKAALRRVPKIAAIIADIQAERGSADDGEALLAELGE